jgi:cell filamentation protein
MFRHALRASQSSDGAIVHPSNMPEENVDPYVYEGTNVLKNLRDIRDPGVLSRFEMDMTTFRGNELIARAKPGKLDTHYLRDVHRYLFQDVYHWAGEFRIVRIAKPGALFAFPAYIEWALEDALGKLRNEKHLNGLAADQFAVRAAYYMGELNAIHPFREGNGRTQREFIRQLALHNGFELDWSMTTRDQMMEASILSLRKGNCSLLADIIRVALTNQ